MTPPRTPRKGQIIPSQPHWSDPANTPQGTAFASPVLGFGDTEKNCSDLTTVKEPGGEDGDSVLWLGVIGLAGLRKGGRVGGSICQSPCSLRAGLAICGSLCKISVAPLVQNGDSKLRAEPLTKHEALGGGGGEPSGTAHGWKSFSAWDFSKAPLTPPTAAQEPAGFLICKMKKEKKNDTTF